MGSSVNSVVKPIKKISDLTLKYSPGTALLYEALSGGRGVFSDIYRARKSILRTGEDVLSDIGKSFKNPFAVDIPEPAPPPEEAGTPEPSADQLATLSKRRGRGKAALRIDVNPGLSSSGGAGLRL